jgi:drug/metabolite transporter (DMT)-like permease
VLFALLRPKWPKGNSWQLIAFAVFGILPSQLFFFLAIDFSNAAIATLLQILFLPMVAAYEILTHVYKFSYSHLAAITLAMGGTFLLVVASGSSATFSLRVTPLGFAFGVLCAISASYNTLASRKLVVNYGSWTITTWGFVIASVVSLPFGVPTLIHAEFALPVIGLILFIAFFGTLLTYGLYVMSLKRLTGTEAAVTSMGEPISASIASYVLLGVLLTPFQYFGAALILVSLYFLGKMIKRPKGMKKEVLEGERKGP